MNYFYTTLQIILGILAPLILTLLILSAYQAIYSWSEQKRWDAHYDNPKDKRKAKR